MGCEVLYPRFFAIIFPGKHYGTVGQWVNPQQHVSLYPKGGKFSFNTVGILTLPYIPTIQRTDRAFNKLNNFIRNKIKFYSTSIRDSKYDELTKCECGNCFGTVELWYQALILFDKKSRRYLQNKNNNQFFLYNMNLTQEANNSRLSYFWFISKITI